MSAVVPQGRNVNATGAASGTSGCIRARANDEVRHGFLALVVGDRHAGPHKATLFDIDAQDKGVVSRALTDSDVA